MKYLPLIFGILFFSSCSPRLKQSYAKLSKPEKTWVVFHPFKAKRAFLISQEANKIKDSITGVGLIGSDNNGGALDAFKHSYWMARLTQGIGKRAAYSLGKAHEKGNYQTFKKRQLEEGFLPDKPSTEMDLFNNKVGINIGFSHKEASAETLVQKLLDSLKHGKLRILNKDLSGNFLDCQNKKIPLDSLKHKWDNKKCLIPSNN